MLGRFVACDLQAKILSIQTANSRQELVGTDDAVALCGDEIRALRDQFTLSIQDVERRALTNALFLNDS